MPDATNPGPQALAGLRVLDLGQQIAGPFCARLLADQGADVIKVESPAGDVARRIGPFVGDDAHPEKSLHFLYLNYNKRSVTLDLKTPQGRERLLALVQTADILVENYEPGFLASLGLGYDVLSTANPRLIVTSITNFGQTGPKRDWRGNDLINYALSGCMYISGTSDREPVKHGQFQSGYCGGLAGLIPTLAALYQREQTGLGQFIDVSIVEALASTLVMMLPYYSYMGETQRRRDLAGGTYGNCTEARDGYVIPHATRNREWDDFCDIVGEPRLKDPKYSSSKGRIANAEEMDRLLGEALKKINRFDLFHQANKKRLLCGVAQTPEDIANCEQMAARGFFHEMDHPVAGKLRYPGQTFETTEGGFKIRHRPPLLGEHNDEILNERRVQPIAVPTSKKATSRKPLEGIRIIDATHVFAIPYATGLLADMGAEVIKIHAHTRIDVMAAQGPFPENQPGENFWDRVGSLNTVNRGKLSLALDLTKPEAIEIFKRLVEKSDVVAESYTPRVMKKFGLDYPSLKRLRPDLIMLSNTGYGHTGPWNAYGCVATSMEGTSGMCWLSGYRDGAPSKVSQSYTDFLACWNAIYTMLLALYHRRRTGRGQWIDLSMYQVGAQTIGPAIMDYIANGRVQGRIGNRHPTMAPHGVFPCKGDDRWLAIAVDSDATWKILAAEMGGPAWASDSRFATLAGRQQHEDELEQKIGDWTKGQDAVALAEKLQGRGVMAALVQCARDVFLDPQFAARRFFEPVLHNGVSALGERVYIGRPWKLSGADLAIAKPAPTLGEHNRQILVGLLGYSEAEVDRLDQAGVVGSFMKGPRGTPTNPPLALEEMRKRGRIGAHDPDYRSRQKAMLA